MKTSRAFVLLEVMLGVAIFAIGVISLGRCVNNCLTAETARSEDQRARLVLENLMAQIEAGETPIDQPKTTELEGAFAGMTLTQSRTPLKENNEKKQELTGLYSVELEVTWKVGREPQSKKLSFYVLRQ